MTFFLITSIIASILLTLALNFLPRVFPGAARKAERTLTEHASNGPRGRVWFPWKVMLIGSVVLTVLVNVVAFSVR